MRKNVLTWVCVVAALVIGTIASNWVSAQEKDKSETTYTDPTDAGPDFAYQGEYLGKGEIDGQEITIGAHVIALGDGKFEVVGYFGGLPGEGWSRGDRAVRHEGAKEGDKVVFKGDDGVTSTVADKKITVATGDGREVAVLDKVERKSPTLGAKAPSGAVVLFDGTNADAWERGKIVMDKLLASDCETKQKFNDFTLHVEFRTPFKPYARGQARGNSGVYIQGRYELQVLDSFGLEGENNECGGIYQIAKPNVNMCLPPLSWQTYDIEFTAAKYDAEGKKTATAKTTIKHNGVIIHENLELPKGTPGKDPEGPGPGCIYFQGHGNPVVYQNVWIVENK
jgi:hypothetical protein